MRINFMSTLTKASRILFRHNEKFEKSYILFAGNIQDDLPIRFVCTKSYVSTQYYHSWKTLSFQMKERAHFGLIPKRSDINRCNTLIFFWPKNKEEAQFQLINLLSLWSRNCDIFIVGDNHSGVRSGVKMVQNWIALKKIDSARRCCLYQGRLKERPIFSMKNFWKEYQFDKFTIKTLPGVFSRNTIDMGSQLLVSTLTSDIKRKRILNIGCGSGILAIMLVKCFPKAKITLCDVSAFALEATEATFTANGFIGKIFPSDVFSDITERYDLIISNPPFHDGIKKNIKVATTLIRGATRHLKYGGELRIVANTFLPYPKILDEVFGYHEIIALNNRFRVYRAIMK